MPCPPLSVRGHCADCDAARDTIDLGHCLPDVVEDREETLADALHDLWFALEAYDAPIPRTHTVPLLEKARRQAAEALQDCGRLKTEGM